jgi:hypothetical protein
MYGEPKTVSVTNEEAALAEKGICIPRYPDILDSFLSLNELIYTIEQTIPVHFSVDGAITEFVAQMSGRAFVSAPMYVRLVWRQEHPRERFDMNDRIHRLQIKDIYVRLGYDYKLDRMFQDKIGLTLVT